MDSSGILRKYTKEESAIKNYYKEKEGADKDTYYVFFVDELKPSDSSIKGFMPRKHQFGFVFSDYVKIDKNEDNETLHTLAHELGHGVFGLEHSKIGTDLLMHESSSTGTEFTHMDWDVMHAAGFKLYLFDSDADGELSEDKGDSIYTEISDRIKKELKEISDRLGVKTYVSVYIEKCEGELETSQAEIKYSNIEGIQKAYVTSENINNIEYKYLIIYFTDDEAKVEINGSIEDTSLMNELKRFHSNEVSNKDKTLLLVGNKGDNYINLECSPQISEYIQKNNPLCKRNDDGRLVEEIVKSIKECLKYNDIDNSSESKLITLVQKILNDPFSEHESIKVIIENKDKTKQTAKSVNENTEYIVELKYLENGKLDYEVKLTDSYLLNDEFYNRQNLQETLGYSVEDFRKEYKKSIEAALNDPYLKKAILSLSDDEQVLEELLKIVKIISLNAKSLWTKCSVAEAMWYEPNPIYGKIPSYLHFNQIFAGLTDYVVEESLGILFMIKEITTFFIDDEKKFEFDKIFNWENIKSLSEAIYSGLKTDLNDAHKQQYVVTKTGAEITIYIATGGVAATVKGVKNIGKAATKLGSKLKELPNATKYLKTLSKQKTKESKELLKKLLEKLNNIEYSKKFEGLFLKIKEKNYIKFAKDFENPSFAKELLDKPELVDAWQKMIRLNADDVIRTNGGALEAFSLPKKSRPNPNTYLPKEYIDNHLKKFDDGGSRIVLKETYNKRGVGKPDEGMTEFISTKAEIDNILTLPVVEQAKRLGISVDEINGGLVRIDFHPSNKIEMPSGKEFGANDKWIPGGKTSGGADEAIIKTERMVLDIDYIVIKL